MDCIRSIFSYCGYSQHKKRSYTTYDNNTCHYIPNAMQNCSAETHIKGRLVNLLPSPSTLPLLIELDSVHRMQRGPGWQRSICMLFKSFKVTQQWNKSGVIKARAIPPSPGTAEAARDQKLPCFPI